jgi:chromate reductase
MNFIGIVGSLRKDSLNRKVLNAASALLPAGSTLEIVEIGNLPLYNQDAETPFPAAATTLKDKIKKSDGVIFATPEFNRTIPGPLGNAIDWISRPYGQNALIGKPALVMSASMGPIGGALAHYALKQSLLHMNMYVLGQPEIFVGVAQDKFDASGKLTDASTKEFLANSLKTFADFAAKFK